MNPDLEEVLTSFMNEQISLNAVPLDADVAVALGYDPGERLSGRVRRLRDTQLRAANYQLAKDGGDVLHWLAPGADVPDGWSLV